jgi:ATP-binding cassette, subfamily B, bacterial
MSGHSDLRTYGRLLRQARRYWPHLAGVFVIRLLAAPLALLTPLPLKMAIDNVIGSRPLPEGLRWILPAQVGGSATALLWLAAGLLVLVALLIALQTLAASLLETYTGENLVLDFRARLFRHVQRLSLSYHDTKGSSDSIYRIQYDAPFIQTILISGVIPVISAMLTLAGMIYITMRLDWHLALISLVVAPVLFVITRVFGLPLRKKWKRLKKLESLALSVVQEVLSAVRVVKAFGAEDQEHRRFMRQSTDRVSEQLRFARLQGGFDLLVGCTVAIGTALTLIIGVLHCRDGSLSVGSLMVVLTYQAQLYEPLKTLSKKTADLQSGLASADRAFALLDETPEVIERQQARSLTRARGKVEFRQVCFSYDTRRTILEDISFDVESGVRVGIQGSTGAGKTTLASLLMRFYDVSSGQILLDDVDIRDYKLDDLRGQFALVLQDTVLFSTSVGENIAYGRPGASQEEIREAARQARAHEFIERLPDGYETRVGERGMLLSGGERQRISLARAFLKDAPILILDEPTSSVDVKTEAAIMATMNELMKGRTTFMIAHRLGTLERCDVRLEIEGGRLKPKGEVAHV